MRSLLLLVVAVHAAAVPAQQPRFVHKPPLPSKVTDRHVQDEVVIKFREGSEVRLRAGRLVSLNRSVDPGRVMRVVGSRKLRRFFLRSEQDLDQERRAIVAALPAGEQRPGELNLYFVVKTAGRFDSENLIDALNEDVAVEVAFADWNPEKAYGLFGDIPPKTPDWSSKQVEHGAAPNGTNAASAWRIAGGRGQNITVAHVEFGWTAEHEDLPKLKKARRLGSTLGSAIYTYHGTACVGILNAAHNDYGVRGYAPEAGLALSGVAKGTANGVSLITKALKAGDVMSSSYGVFLQCGGAGRYIALPPEAGNQADFDAIQNATKKGIIYTVSAGNSGSDLDAKCWNGLFDRKKRDSGALIIAASLTNRRSRAAISNYGTRIDAHAWGSSVYSTGYTYLFNPNGDSRQHYTNRFGGTSAASAQVGGVCASFVSAVREQYGVVVTPKQMRDVLQKYGSPAPSSEKIGSLPDLKKMLAAVRLPDGLQILRDPVRKGALEIQIDGRSGGGFALAASPGRGRTNVGLNRAYLLDPATAVLVELGVFGTSKSVTRKYPIPDAAVLVGLSVYFQVLDWDAGQQLHLSNSVEALVRR